MCQFLSILGLGSGRSPYEDHMRGDHDGTELVAQESIGTGGSRVSCVSRWVSGQVWQKSHLYRVEFNSTTLMLLFSWGLEVAKNVGNSPVKFLRLKFSRSSINQIQKQRKDRVCSNNTCNGNI